MPPLEKNKNKAEYKQRADKYRPGRPPEFKQEYCDMLIAHMKGGNSFESFGAIILQGRSTIYRWEAEHQNFRDAKEIGRALSLKFYEDMGKTVAAGQMKFLTQEIPLIREGKPVYDQEGNAVVKKVYGRASPGQSTWAKIMTNMHGWRDKVELTGADGGPLAYSNMSNEQLQDKVDEILKRAADRKKSSVSEG